jgi:hypothetical protein
MQDQTQQHNPLQKYFRQPKLYISLPSKGNHWPDEALERTETGEYPVYAMTARDEIAIKTPDALLNGQATVDVIQSCVPNIKNAWHMPSIDSDALLIAIRIATYGEVMDLSIKTPVTGEEKDFQVDLRTLLDHFTNVDYDNQLTVGEIAISLKPLTYKEINETSMKTFEQQRIFKVLNDESIPESDKLQSFAESFKKLTDLTVFTLEKSIKAIETPDGVTVDNPAWISEFVSNTDKNLFESITNKIESEKAKFTVKPMVVDATPEEIQQGVPETYEVPISFDQSNFFG